MNKFGNVIRLMLLLMIVLFASNNIYTQTHEVSIYSIDFKNKVNSDSLTPLYVWIYNNDIEALETCELRLFVDGQEELLFEWSGMIESYGSQEVNIGSFQFSEKSPLGSYEVYATISSPNGGEVGGFYSNTITDVRKINPALSGGTYSVGLTSDDFENFTEINQYLQGGGFPTGDVVFNVRPGTYTEPLVLEYYGYYSTGQEGDDSDYDVQTHKLTFQKLPNAIGNVVIQWSGMDNYIEDGVYDEESQEIPQEYENEYYSDYAIYYYGYNDITIKDINIEVEIDEYSYQVGGIYFSDGNGLTIDNCNITFSDAPEDSYVTTYGIYIFSANDVVISNSEIVKGNYGVQVTGYDLCERNLLISNNIFTDQSEYSIYSANYIYNCDTYSNNTVFQDNLFINDLPETSCTAIYSHNGTTISGNSLSGFKGNGNDPGPSLIRVDHSDTDLDDEVIIEDNIIEDVLDMTGITVNNVGAGKISGNDIKIGTGDYNGIDKSAIIYNGAGTDSKYLWAEKNTIEIEDGMGLYLDNTNAKVYKNSIDVIANDSDYEWSGIVSDGSAGYVANNRIRGENANGVLTARSGNNKNSEVGQFFCYNSIAVNSPNNAAFYVNQSTNTTVLRNMLINTGNGVVVKGTSMGGPVWTSNQNNLKTDGANIGSWNLNDYGSLAGFRTASEGDLNSASVDVEFLEDGSLRPKEFTPELVFQDPLFDPNGPFGDIFAECEQFDFFGNERQEFFVGFNNPLIVVTVISEPEDIIDCYGTQGRFFYALATATSGLSPKYQWYKDNEPLEGQTFPGLNLGPLEHNMSGVFKCGVTAQGAGKITFTKEATLYVLNAPSITIEPTSIVSQIGDKATLYVDATIYGEQPPSYKVDVQWYRGNTPLQNNDRFEGVNSNYLTINSVESTDFGDDYWVQLIGNCGSLNSKTISINEAPNVNFNTNPEDLIVCENSDFEIVVDADATNNGTIVSYKWFANGVELNNVDYDGVNTNTLSGTAIENLQNLYVEVTVTPGDLTFKSAEGSLMLNTSPVILTQPMDVEIDENSNGELNIEIENEFNVTYMWFKDGDNTVLSTDESLSFTNIQENESGLYYCVVSNDCGDVTSSSASVTVKTSSMNLSVEELRSEFELSNSPNPTKDETTIFYSITELAEVRIVISEMTGNELFEMNRGMTFPGQYQFKIDANKLKMQSGVYFYTLYVGHKSVTNKFIIEK